MITDWQFLEPHPLAGLFPIMSEEEVNRIADDMASKGYDPAYPIVLYEGKVLDGRNRHAAAVLVRHLNGGTVTPAFVEYEGDDPLSFVVRSNLYRRHLTEGQIAALGVEVEKRYSADAERRRLANLKQVARGPEGENSPPREEPGKSAAKAAKVVGTSDHSIKQAKKLSLDAPDLFEEVKTGTKTLNRAASELKRRERPKPKEAAPLPLAEGRFTVLYADPPWLYEHMRVSSWANENHYPTMETAEICKLKIDGKPVSDKAADDAVLFLWTTSPKLPDALQIIEAWGFSYRSSFVWVKSTNGAGMGYWARVDHEFLLVATRGKISAPETPNRFSSVIEAKKGRHSAKPVEVYQMIEAMLPGVSRLELFARGGKRPNWTLWGNQIIQEEAAD